MIPTLSQVCSLPSTFTQDVQDYAAGQCGSMDVWLTKLEDFVASHSVDAARNVFQEHGVTPRVASFQGGILSSQGPQRKQAWDLFHARLELCSQLDIPTLVVSCDVMGPLTQTDVQRTQTSLVQAAQSAGQRGMRLGLEFQARAAFGNNLQTAAAMVEEVGSPHLGLCLDAFHFFIGPSKLEDLRYLTTGNLFHVQLSDLADTPREFATDADRILPGDGDFPLGPLIEHLQAIQYAGTVSIELMNPHIWQVPPLQFGEIGMTALRKLLGQATMD